MDAGSDAARDGISAGHTGFWDCVSHQGKEELTDRMTRSVSDTQGGKGSRSQTTRNTNAKLLTLNERGKGQGGTRAETWMACPSLNHTLNLNRLELKDGPALLCREPVTACGAGKSS